MKAPSRAHALVGVAVALAIGVGAAHLLGLRDAVSVLSGTPPESDTIELVGALGLGYVLGWLGLVVLAPILVIAAAIDALASMWWRPAAHTHED